MTFNSYNSPAVFGSYRRETQKSHSIAGSRLIAK